MKKIILLNLIVILSISVSYSQLSKKDKSLGGINDYKLAEAYIFEGKFNDAIEIYKDLLKKKPNDNEIHFRIGYCYLNTTERYKSIPHLEKVVNDYKAATKKKNPPTDAYYYLAKAYYYNYDFQAAITTYEELKPLLKSKRLQAEINKEINKCNNAEILVNNPKEMIVTRLGIINSSFPDHSPVITADEKQLYFTSMRGDFDTEKTEGAYFEDIYVYDKTEGMWTKPHPIQGEVNTIGNHEATCGLSIDGQEMFIYIFDKSNNGDIYMSKLDGTKWTKPEKLNKNINTLYRESHASLSPDKKVLFFTSNRPGGNGGSDIYMSRKGEDGDWGPAINLGEIINTPQNEEGPYLHPDGKTLYFSSEGHNSMGGFDIFTSTIQADNIWSTPENLGFPLNTLDDDVFFVPTIDGMKGYYASKQEGPTNIYITTLYDINSKNITLVSGHTYDSDYKDNTYNKSDIRTDGDTVYIDQRKIYKEKSITIDDKVYITDKIDDDTSIKIVDSTCVIPKNTTIMVVELNNKTLDNIYGPNYRTGKYLFVVPSTKDYLIHYDAEGHIYDTKFLDVDNNSFNKIFYNAELDKIEKGKVKNTKYSEFDKNSNDLNNRTQTELDFLAKFMDKHKDLYVDFSTHDYLVPGDPNDEPRKNTAVDYLKQKGISENRILTDLSPNPIGGDSIEFTIYDEITKKQAQEDKEKRIKDNETKIIAEVKKVHVHDITFEINKFKTEKYNANLDSLADYLVDNRDARVEINGYTDQQGPSKFNKELSWKRARFVKDYLIAKSVHEQQVEIKGRGYDTQISINKDKNGNWVWKSLEYNRRIEFVVITQGQKANLVIENIIVPDEYKPDSEKKKIIDIYSIKLFISTTAVSMDKFKDIAGVKMHKDTDGTYVYYYGSFNSEEDAEKELKSIIQKYPQAITFINKY